MKAFKIILLFATLLFSSLGIFATAQSPDIILYNGKERPLFANPLEDYFPDEDKRPKFWIEPLTTSSGNWRGYVATWEINEGKLYITKIDSWFCKTFNEESCSKVKLSDVFGQKVQNGRVLADWFTGDLRIPDGKRLQYVHMGYASTYERDIIFTAEKGVLSSPTIIDNTKSELSSPMDAAFRELDKMKAAEDAKSKQNGGGDKKPLASDVLIVPGQGVFKHGTTRADLEKVVGKGKAGNPYDDGTYFVDYTDAGVQASYIGGKNTVKVIFLYNKAPRRSEFAVPQVRADKGISWNSTDEDILKAYGKPSKDFGDDGKSWRRIEYPGIDFMFERGRLVRIGILGPDGN